MPLEFPRFGGQFWAWKSSHINVFLLVVHRREMSERRMSPVGVVKSFDVVEDLLEENLILRLNSISIGHVTMIRS